MLAELQRRHPRLPAVLADAHRLPLCDRAVDLVVFVATLEFLDAPPMALAEAARVARLGLVAIALNRWSVGGLSRRIGPASRGQILPHAHDLSARALRRLLAEAAAPRRPRLRARTALLPRPLPANPTALPFGDVVGVSVDLGAA
jgi:ubiquinone/menaquinone biosynthesis C-methylase UbiE